MGLYRVVKQGTFRVGREDVLLSAGSLIEVQLRQEAVRMMAEGLICKPEQSHRVAGTVGTSPLAAVHSATKRIGIWLVTSKHYSGGRIHMWQFAWNLAHAGAEVWLITDGQPKWREDYAPVDGLKVLQIWKDPIPGDIDLIVTDNKGPLGEAALQYKRDHPLSPLVCFNFETPNWIALYAPDYAARIGVEKGPFTQADYLIANSELSAKYLLEWLDNPPTPWGIVYPAVNTHAAEQALALGPMPHTRPYCMVSSRAADYKGMGTAAEAIWRYPGDLDLIIIGQPHNLPPNAPNHASLAPRQVSDIDKLRWMAGARAVLAPSLFEGYGMVPGECLTAGSTPVVYDLPVLRQAYGDRLVYAKWGDKEDFVRKVAAVVSGTEKPIEITTRDSAGTLYGMAMQARQIDALPYLAMKRKRVSVQLLAYWGFCPETIEAVYPHVDEILVAGGPTAYAPPIDDGTRARLEAVPDPEHKIRVEWRDHWKDKLSMRLWCCSKATGNHMLVLDGDEIWVGLDQWLASDIKFGCPRWINLWHDCAHWIHDAGKERRWGKPIDGVGSLCPHYRWSWWRPSYTFRTHPAAVDASDNVLHVLTPDASKKVPECRIYHLGHALPRAVMAAKHRYYLDRDGTDEGRIRRRDVWTDWQSKTGEVGDGIVESVAWDVPEIVKRAWEGMQSWTVKA